MKGKNMFHVTWTYECDGAAHTHGMWCRSYEVRPGPAPGERYDTGVTYPDMDAAAAAVTRCGGTSWGDALSSRVVQPRHLHVSRRGRRGAYNR